MLPQLIYFATNSLWAVQCDAGPNCQMPVPALTMPFRPFAKRLAKWFARTDRLYLANCRVCGYEPFAGLLRYGMGQHECNQLRWAAWWQTEYDGRSDLGTLRSLINAPILTVRDYELPVGPGSSLART